MSQGRQLVEKSVLRTLVPAQSLNAENFQELAGKTYLEEVSAGRVLFKKGDVDRKAVYVLSGAVEVVGDDGSTQVIKGGSPESRHPIGNQQPRQVSAKARGSATITRIDSDLLDILLTWDQLSGIEVVDVSQQGEDDESGDWMSRILQSKAFLRIPPANIQHMFMRLQELPVKAGQVVINQGDDGDYYYIISRGRCKVTRESANGASVTLAHLSDGDAFGEEALLSDSKRNATIEMETDGLLMRLSKDDFEEGRGAGRKQGVHLLLRDRPAQLRRRLPAQRAGARQLRPQGRLAGDPAPGSLIPAAGAGCDAPGSSASIPVVPVSRVMADGTVRCGFRGWSGAGLQARSSASRK
jgi:CRP-like cAMP-binding protein